MTDFMKSEIGHRLREKREAAGYTREKFAELCSLSPRFIANIELGDATFSLDTLMIACRVLACSSDYLLFGTAVASTDPWQETIERLKYIDVEYQAPVNKAIQAMLEIIRAIDIEKDMSQS